MNELLLYVYNSKKINEALNKMCKKYNIDDLRSHLLIELSKKEEKKVIELLSMNRKELDYYCIRILLNQLKSNTSSFHKLYSVVYVSGNNKKHNFSLLDLDVITDLMDDNDNITDELKNEILNIEDEKIEDNSLYYKRKVEKIKNILLHIKPIDALLFNFYYFDGMSYADISRMSGVNWQSIRYSVVKTLEVVKNKLKEDDY